MDVEGFLLPLHYCRDDGGNKNCTLEAVPEDFIERGRSYINDAIAFIQEFSWVYDIQITRILVDQHLEKVPREWAHFFQRMSCDDLNSLPFSPIMGSIPHSLEVFLETCKILSLPRNPIIPSQNEQVGRMKRTNPKKQHEILSMAALVQHISNNTNCSLVVDIGAGLGYLSTLVAKESSLQILAMECKDALTHGTKDRGIKQDVESLEAVTFTLRDSESSFGEARKIVNDRLQEIMSPSCENRECQNTDLLKIEATKFTSEAGVKETAPNASASNKCLSGDPLPGKLTEIDKDQSEKVLDSETMTHHKLTNDSQVASNPCVLDSKLSAQNPEIKEKMGRAFACMIGLHCCGSLTPSMLKLFSSTREFRSLVCVGCCYHGMEQNDENAWRHFPLSKTVRDIWSQNYREFAMSVYGLRLAAQETRARWRSQTEEDHNFHRKNVGFRALLELVCEKENLELKKIKRHLTRKNHMTDLDSFADAILERSSLNETCPNFKQKLLEEYKNQEEMIKLLEPFTALQVCLQSVLESFILIDRVLYLHEAGIPATLVPLFDENISPRNMAIVAIKP